MIEVRRFNHRGHTVRVVVDPDPISPRDYGGMWWFVLRYSRNCERVEGPVALVQGESIEELTKRIQREVGRAMVVPIRCYEHSGVAFSMCTEYPFNDPWDSYWAGVAYVTYAELREEYKRTRVTKTTRELAIKILSAELEAYNDYVEGRVYGYIVDSPAEEDVASCWGFYGRDADEDGYMDAQAREEVDSMR